MILNELSVLNYKNIVHANIFCSSKMNCFFGNNGMGKTNLLDAIYYLSFCKSHIHTSEKQIIHKDEEICVVQGKYNYNEQKEDIFCAMRRGQRKQFKRNQKAYDKLSEHIGLLPLVMVSPADSELIRGGSDERRRLLDVIISQHDKSYLHALIQYNKALMQRNLMLKNQSYDTALYEVLEMQLSMHGQLIYQKRKELVASFIPLFNKYYQTICQSAEIVSLQYVSQLENTALDVQLAADRNRERIVGHTLAGIHKDDLEMMLDDRLIRHTGSQGQNKTFLIALKLAQYSFLSARGTTKPILLLDDVFDKLDAERVEQIIQLVSGEEFGQIFMTDTNRKYLDQILLAINKNFSLFKLEKGEVIPIEE